MNLKFPINKINFKTKTEIQSITNAKCNKSTNKPFLSVNYKKMNIKKI